MSDYVDVSRSERQMLVRRASGLALPGGNVAPVNTVLPVITGTLTVGQTLTSSTGTWTGSAPITYTYQWKRAGVAIGGATASTYMLVTADGGALITFTVTGTNAFGNSSATSASVGPIVAVGGAFLLTGETDGFATDFQYAADADRVAVKAASVVTNSGLDAFYQNASTSPKMVYDVTGALVWSPHNLCLQSQTLDHASWTKTACTVGANAVAAPFTSALEADAIIPNAGSNIPFVQSAAISVVATAPYTYSAYVKNGILGNNWMSIEPVSSSTFRCWFNLATGVKGTTVGSPITYNATNIGNGWYRLDVTFPGGGSTSLQCGLYARSADGVQTAITGDGTSPAFYAWGAQVNRGTAPTAYLPTTTAARYGLAIDYDPVTHVAKGVAQEPTATNLLLNSTTLSTQSPTVTAVAHTLSFWGTGTITLSGASTAGPLVGTGANNRVTLNFTPAAGALTCTVTGTVSNAQLEISSSIATSYIPTYAATATRAADNYKVTPAQINYSSTAGTWWIEAEIKRFGGNDTLIGCAPSSNSPLFASHVNQFGFYDGNIFYTAAAGGSTLGVHKVACAFASADRALTTNGNAPTLNTAAGTALLTGNTLLGVGSIPTGIGTNFSTNWIRKVKYLPRRQSNAELQSSTV